MKWFCRETRKTVLENRECWSRSWTIIGLYPLEVFFGNGSFQNQSSADSGSNKNAVQQDEGYAQIEEKRSCMKKNASWYGNQPYRGKKTRWSNSLGDAILYHMREARNPAPGKLWDSRWCCGCLENTDVLISGIIFCFQVFKGFKDKAIGQTKAFRTIWSRLKLRAVTG